MQGTIKELSSNEFSKSGYSKMISLEIRSYFQSETIKILAFNGFRCLKAIKLLKTQITSKVWIFENILY